MLRKTDVCSNRPWPLSPLAHHNKARLYLFLIPLIIFCAREISNIFFYTRDCGYALNIGEYVFAVLYCGGNMPYTSIIYLVLLGDMKHFCNNSQKRWHTILYCYISSVVMVIAITVLSFLIAVFLASPGNTWTELLLLSNNEIGISVIPTYVQSSMGLAAANILAAVMLQAFWFSTGLFMYIMALVNLQEIGIMIYAFILFGSSIFIGKPSFAFNSIYSLQAVLNHAEIGGEKAALIHSWIILFVMMSILIFLIWVIPLYWKKVKKVIPLQMKS